MQNGALNFSYTQYFHVQHKIPTATRMVSSSMLGCWAQTYADFDAGVAKVSWLAGCWVLSCGFVHVLIVLYEMCRLYCVPRIFMC